MYSNTAVFASSRVRKRTWWTCSVLSEGKKLSMGALSRHFPRRLLDRGIGCRSSTLHGRVIEAVAAAAHGLRDGMPLQHRVVGLGRVLHAAVVVVAEPA